MTKQTQEFIRINHAAAKYGISTSVLRWWILEERLRAYRPSAKLTLLRLADLKALIEEQPASLFAR